MKVAVTGGTGLVGSRLVERLQQQGHQVLLLVRNPERARQLFPSSKFANLEIITYTPKAGGEWQRSLDGCDGVVNLAGEPLFGARWTAESKREILESRQLGTQRLVEAIAQAQRKPQVLVSTSAIGHYGTSETATFDETSAPGADFLAGVCKAWEAEAQKVTESGVRLVILRMGIVLAPGGALAQMVPPFKLGVGGPIGSGRQWFSWVHREDAVSLILYALTNSKVSGVLNATAPEPVRMVELCDALGKAVNRPSWLPVPNFALELLLGDAAQIVLEGQRVLPKQTQAVGFQYQYPEINGALQQVVSQL
ncbi:TIGR01777 family oxidoreductase [Leptolyngbya sp. FACHB-261]|uniref:thylakoid membrane protein ThyD n=1 Tax=Leptolyngbya sp. FACHB-261 TaxID=2692806 RepID=UPI001687AAF3|nr:TIGR01777 family oxidoreductase [Leptolyngbya sp. FACHB-261]MBD2104621.1 TIGR01777 family protein [Leptolyngbya sp. FACHB-261]